MKKLNAHDHSIYCNWDERDLITIFFPWNQRLNWTRAHTIMCRMYNLYSVVREAYE